MTLLAKRNGSIFPRVVTDLLDANDFFPGVFENSWDMAIRVPSVNITENEKAFNVEMAAPGLEKKDFKIELENKTLVISSEKEEETNESGKDYKRQEFSYRSFSRSFQLPEDVLADKIKAKYEDGILKLEIPKKEVAVAKSKKEIKIS